MMNKIYITGALFLIISTVFFLQRNTHKEQLFDGVRNGDLVAIKKAIEDGADINSRDGVGQTALHSASYRSNVKTLNILLKYGANIEAKENRGGTPLHWAAVNGKTQNLLFLIKKGAEIEAEDTWGMTPLRWAADNGKVNSVKALLDTGANPNHLDKNGKNALYYARRKRNTSIMELLRDKEM